MSVSGVGDPSPPTLTDSFHEIVSISRVACACLSGRGVQPTTRPWLTVNVREQGREQLAPYEAISSVQRRDGDLAYLPNPLWKTANCPPRVTDLRLTRDLICDR